MLKIKYLVPLLFFIVIQNANCQSGNLRVKLNIYDSVVVEEFIVKSNLCEKIKYVKQEISAFASLHGYAQLILKSISDSTNYPLFITIGNGGNIESEKNRIRFLKEQIFEIEEKKCR